MKVFELMEKLKAMPPDAEVETEGCDCIGQANGVELQSDGSVLILRRLDDADRQRQSLLYPPVYEIATDEEIEEAVQ